MRLWRAGGAQLWLAVDSGPPPPSIITHLLGWISYGCFLYCSLVYCFSEALIMKDRICVITILNVDAPNGRLMVQNIFIFA